MKIRFIGMICLLLSGCMLSPVKTDFSNRYVLKSVSSKRYTNTPSHLTLFVSQPTTNPGLQSEEIIYVNRAYQLNYFGKNEWVAPPSQLLLPLLVESLRNTNYFHAVMSPPFAGLVDIRLETQLKILQQEFYSDHSQVRMSLQVTIINNIDNRILSSRAFDEVVVSPTADPYGGVIAANKATEHLLQRITAYVIATMRKL